MTGSFSGVSGVWKSDLAHYEGVSGVWKNVVGEWIGVSGVWKQYFGGGGFVPYTNTYNGSGSGNDGIPSGAVQVVIRCYGKGGPGATGVTLARRAGGGGGGGLSVKTVALSGDAGVNLAYVIDGTSSRVTGTVTAGAIAVTANVGIVGNTAASGNASGGAGGTASGGDSNVTGVTGGSSTGPSPGGDGGAGADTSAGGAGGDSSGGPGSNGTDPSGGGGGGPYDAIDLTDGVPGLGAIGRITFTYT